MSESSLHQSFGHVTRIWFAANSTALALMGRAKDRTFLVRSALQVRAHTNGRNERGSAKRSVHAGNSGPLHRDRLTRQPPIMRQNMALFHLG